MKFRLGCWLKPSLVLAVGAAVFACSAITPTTSAQMPADPVERLHRAEAETSLETPDLKPWHLKMTFELLGSKSAIVDSGVIEEWCAPGRHRIAINSNGYSYVEVLNGAGLFQSTDVASVPYPMDLLRTTVIHPLQQRLPVDGSQPEVRRQAFNKVPMDCIMLSRKIGVGALGGREMNTVVPLGLFPTFCLDQGKDTVRLISDLGTQTIVLNRLGRFQGHSVAIDLSTVSSGAATSRGHVEVLTSSTPDDGRYEDVRGLSPVETHPVMISTSTAAGKLLTKPQPIYPESAKTAHVAGTVILRASIGRDGHIRDMALVQVPSPDLAIAAVQAVKNWTYSPYILNGKPVEVDTTITVHFEMQPQ